MPRQNPQALYDIAPLQRLLADDFVLLTPNLRLARRIKAEWDRNQAASGAVVWRPIPVQSLELWLQQCWQQAVTAGQLPSLVLLNGGHMLELWRQIIAHHGAADTLLQPAAAATLAQQARESLLRWQLQLTDPAIAQQFQLDADCATFAEWLQALQQRLQASGQGGTTDALLALAQCSDWQPAYKVALLEFDEIPPLYRSCLEQLCSTTVEVPAKAAQGRQLATAFDDRQTELEAVANWVGELSHAQPRATVGIVLADMQRDRATLEYLLRREFDCLGERYASLPVNFSTGLPLDQVPLVRDALRLLQLSRPQQQQPPALVVAVLQSRFVDLPDRESSLTTKFIQQLYAEGGESVDAGALRYSANQVQLAERRGLRLGENLQAVATMRELRGRMLPSQWVPVLARVLEIWGWPGTGALDSLEYQQLEQWQQVLDNFAGYDAISGNLAAADALLLLQRCCAEQIAQPKTADSNVQVLGPLEAAGLHFEHLWLSGMQASAWPAPARPNPFIPVSLQRRLQMPHASAEREWEFTRGLMAQYSRAAPLLHASYARQIDGVPELPSALIQNFEWQQAGLPQPLPDNWLQQIQASNLELCDDSQAPIVDASELAQLGGGAGLLEDQSQCPFRAVAKRRLRVEPLGDPVIALSSGERGSLLHDALYALWGELKTSQALQALDNTAESAVIERAVNSAMEALPAPRRLRAGAAYCALEAQRLQHLLAEWVQVERQRSDFVVQAREQEIELELDRLKIRLRVDRIDTLDDGGTVIIDYKSGASKVADWLGERPAKPQLLLYGIASATPVAALSFAQVRTRDCKFVGLGQQFVAAGIETDIAKAVKDKMPATDWDQLNQLWAQQLQTLARQFLAGQAAVDPLGPGSCMWCGLQPLCRIDTANRLLEGET